MAKKYYAVREGKKVGVFTTWSECKEYVSGYSGAEYKSFKNKKDAMEYLNDVEEVIPLKEKDIVAEDSPRAIAYVDGSYNDKIKEFSYGAVIFWKGKEYHFSDRSDDVELVKMRNVSGELKGAEKAMEFALENNIERLTIYHDYEGIAKWCTGAWKTNKEGTKAYKRFYDEAKKSVHIDFVKVKGHSGDKYNDLADKLAKEAFEK